MIVTATTTPSSHDPPCEMEKKLRAVIATERKIIDEMLSSEQDVPRDVIDLRTCKLAIPKFKTDAVLRQPSAQSGTS